MGVTLPTLSAVQFTLGHHTSRPGAAGSATKLPADSGTNTDRAKRWLVWCCQHSRDASRNGRLRQGRPSLAGLGPCSAPHLRDL